MQARRFVAAAASLLAALMLCTFTSVASAQAGTANCAPGIGTRVPVLLVHGFLGKPADWNTMVAAIHSQVPGAYTATLDYTKDNTDWVSDPNIGPKLATTITCMAAASKEHGGPGKVILVDHSMGGLATRYAATMTPQASTVTADLGLVVTIATPNIGSGWANQVSPMLYSLCHPVDAGTTNITPTNGSLCSALNALGGLADMSSEITKLPKLPSSVPILAIAGNVTLTTPFFHSKIVDTGSDLVVSEKSALWAQLANGFGGEFTVSCSATASIHLLDANCWHSALTRNPQVVRQTVDAIEHYVMVINAAAEIAPYTGTWFSSDTGLTMVMSPTGQATFTWSNNRVVAQFEPVSTGLHGIITSGAPGTGFVTGGPLGLKMAPDGGVLFNPHRAADGTELYRPGSIAPYVGKWYAHSTSVTISSNGTGSMFYRDYDSCPLPNSAKYFMCNIEASFRLTVTTHQALATITDSTATASNGQGATIQGSSQIPNGATFRLTPDGEGLVQVNMTGLPYGGGTFNICKEGTEAYASSQCGA